MLDQAADRRSFSLAGRMPAAVSARSRPTPLRVFCQLFGVFALHFVSDLNVGRSSGFVFFLPRVVATGFGARALVGIDQ